MQIWTGIIKLRDSRSCAMCKVWQIDFKWCMITYVKSAINVCPILPMNFTLTILRVLWESVIENVQIIVVLGCVL